MIIIDEKSKLYQFLVDMCCESNNLLDKFEHFIEEVDHKKYCCMVNHNCNGLTFVIQSDFSISVYEPKNIQFRISDGQIMLMASDVLWPDGTFKMISNVWNKYFDAFKEEERREKYQEFQRRQSGEIQLYIERIETLINK